MTKSNADTLQDTVTPTDDLNDRGPMSFLTQPLNAYNEGLLSEVSRMNGAYVSGAFAINAELAKFFATRLEHDADLGRRLGECKSLSEALDAQSAWMREASDEYTEEAKKLMQMGTQLNDSMVDSQDTPLK